MKQRVKQGLTRVGASLPLKALRALNGAVNYLEVGKWMRTHGFEPSQRYDFLERSGYRFRLFGATRELTHVAFVREA